MNTNTTVNYPVFAIGQSGDEGEELLLRFQRTVQIHGRFSGPYPNKKHPHYKPKYVFRVAGFPNVQALVAICWPWLSRTKREQAVKVLEAYHRSHPPAYARTHCPKCESEWVEPNIAYNPASRSWRCRICRRKNPSAARPAAHYRRTRPEIVVPVRTTQHPRRVKRD